MNKIAKYSSIKKAILLLIGITIIAALLFGYANDTINSTEQVQNQTTNKSENKKLSGQIIIDGSSTVYPISQAMAEQFKKRHPDTDISVTASGTGGGFDKFVKGNTDINDASRTIKPSELQECWENGVRYVRFKIATDGITVVTNNNANWYNSLSMKNLSQIWGPDNPPQKWSEINPNWPDKNMKLYGPTRASGTFDFFTEKVIGEEDASRMDYQKTENDHFIIQKVMDSKYSMGYLGFAYYKQNKDHVKAAPINGVKPNIDTISSGEYLLSRPLFFYVNINHLKNNSVLQGFVEFYLKKSSGDIISDVGYIPSTDINSQEQLDKYKKVINENYQVEYKK